MRDLTSGWVYENVCVASVWAFVHALAHARTCAHTHIQLLQHASSLDEASIMSQTVKIANIYITSEGPQVCRSPLG